MALKYECVKNLSDSAYEISIHELIRVEIVNRCQHLIYNYKLSNGVSSV